MALSFAAALSHIVWNVLHESEQEVGEDERLQSIQSNNYCICRSSALDDLVLQAPVPMTDFRTCIPGKQDDSCRV